MKVSCSISHSFYLLFFFTLLQLAWQQVRPPVEPDIEEVVCENITEVTVCGDIYPLASFPNARGHLTAEEALREFLNFNPLIRAVCSNGMVHFLCSIYFPFCEVGNESLIIRPCQELCQHVRLTCEDDLAEFGLGWPPHLNCDNFAPDNTTDLDFCPIDLQQVTYPSSVVTNPPPPTPEMIPEIPSLHTCENITNFPICSEFYNASLYPNFLHQSNQQIAINEFLNVVALVQDTCSNATFHFLCSIYAPPCEADRENNVLIPPCQELCLHVQSTCKESLSQSYVSLFSLLDCDNFLPDIVSFEEYCPEDFNTFSTLATSPLPVSTLMEYYFLEGSVRFTLLKPNSCCQNHTSLQPQLVLNDTS